jgi:hypothetical protein
VNNLDSDLRGDTALAILAYLAWSDGHGDARKMLDGSISAWLTAGRPDDPQIARALGKLRSQIARYVDRGGHVPEWFPKSLLEAIHASWCAPDLQLEPKPEIEPPTKKEISNVQQAQTSNHCSSS